MKKRVTCLAGLMAILMFGRSINGSGQDGVKKTEPPSVIVFVCEHGAAKSVVSAAYFNKLAKEQNLPFRAIARGTNPDNEISPRVREGLERDGVTSVTSIPTKISRADLVGTERIVTFCSLPDEYADKIRIERWDDLQWVSEDYGNSRDRILERVSRLLEALKSNRQKGTQ